MSQLEVEPAFSLTIYGFLELKSFSLEHGDLNLTAGISSFPSIKSLTLMWNRKESAFSTPPFSTLFPSVTTLSLSCLSNNPVQPFGRNLQNLHLGLDHIDLESIRSLENLKLLQSVISFSKLCKVILAVPGSLHSLRVGEAGYSDDWSSLLELFKSNPSSLQELQSFYISRRDFRDSCGDECLLELKLLLEKNKKIRFVQIISRSR